MSSLSSSRSDLCPSTTVSSSTSTGTLTDTGTITEEHPAPAPAPWRACAICLEDMVDSDLVSHIHCTAVLCRECLDRSARATPDKCPVCLERSQASEWVQLDLAGGALVLVTTQHLRGRTIQASGTTSMMLMWTQDCLRERVRMMCMCSSTRELAMASPLPAKRSLHLDLQ